MVAYAESTCRWHGSKSINLPTGVYLDGWRISETLAILPEYMRAIEGTGRTVPVTHCATDTE